MHHCVNSYMEDCIDGETRIFSIRNSSDGLHFATAEIIFYGGLWKLAQLKGKWNQELIHIVKDTADPLTIALDVLVNFYNKISE